MSARSRAHPWWSNPAETYARETSAYDLQQDAKVRESLAYLTSSDDSYSFRYDLTRPWPMAIDHRVKGGA